MMLKKILCFFAVISCMVVTACTDSEKSENSTKSKLPSEYNIGLVTDPVVANAQFLTQAINALMGMQTQHGFKARHIVAKDTASWTQESRKAAEAGYDLLIGVGWAAAEAFGVLAYNYPNTKFCVVDVLSTDKDVKSMVFNVTDGAYVLGVIVATAFPEENIFGFIGNYDDIVNLKYRYGYEQGVLSVNPHAKFLFSYANTYNNPVAVYDKAMSQFREGVRFIAGTTSTQANLGLFKAVAEFSSKGENVYASGVGVDQTTPENPNIIAGLTKDTGVAIDLAINEFLNKAFKSGPQRLDFETGGFGVLFVTDKNVRYRNESIITDEVILAGERAVQDIITGKIKLNEPDQRR